MINSCTKAMGIDISRTSVKAVCVDEKGVLDSYGIEDLPPNAGDTDVILALKKIISPDCYKCDVVIGLRGLDVLTKKVLLKNVSSAEEMEQRVEEEIKDLLPVDREEVVVSWEVVKQTDHQLEAIIIAVPNKVIERYRRLVDGVGLKIKALEINGLALKRSFESELKNRSMIVDVHADETDIEFYQNGVLTLDKTVPVGGMNITRALSRKLNISVEEAELKKRENKNVDEREYREIYQATIDEILSEIVKTVSMLKIDYGFQTEEILLTGGDFNTLQVAEYAVEKLVEVSAARVVVPLPVMKSDNIDKNLGDKLRLGNALGLALK